MRSLTASLGRMVNTEDFDGRVGQPVNDDVRKRLSLSAAGAVKRTSISVGRCARPGPKPRPRRQTHYDRPPPARAFPLRQIEPPPTGGRPLLAPVRGSRVPRERLARRTGP